MLDLSDRRKGKEEERMGNKVMVGDLRPGYYDLSLFFSQGGEKRVRGLVVKRKRGNYLHVRYSPKRSFGPGTVVGRVFAYASKLPKPK